MAVYTTGYGTDIENSVHFNLLVNMQYSQTCQKPRSNVVSTLSRFEAMADGGTREKIVYCAELRYPKNECANKGVLY